MKAAALSKGRRRPISSFEEHRLLTGGALLGGVAVLIPLLALIALSLSGSGADWAHLARNVLPVALKTTAWVMAGVTLLTASMGIIPAWLTAYYDFPGRRVASTPSIPVRNTSISTTSGGFDSQSSTACAPVFAVQIT